MIRKIKQLLLERSNIKAIFILLVICGFTLYAASSLLSYDRMIPENPLQAEAKNYSEVPLSAQYLKSDLPDEDELESQEQEDKEQLEDEEDISDDLKDKTDLAKEKELKDQSNWSVEANDDSPHVEFLDPTEAKDDIDKEKEDYFSTSIDDGEVVSKQTYSFRIQQLEHDLAVESIDVLVNEKRDDIQNIAEDKQQTYVTVDLSKGENTITVAVTYRDDSGEIFTAVRDYTVVYAEGEVVFETDLEDEMVVEEEELTFTAQAKIGDTNIPLSVKHQYGNEETGVQEKEDQYVAHLQEGENKITLSATSDGNKKEETFVVYYEEPSPTEITITTDLGDYHEKEVKDEDLQFRAEAHAGEESISLDVKHNGQILEGDDNTYDVTLEEGENTFILEAKKDDTSHSETYLVYYNPEATEGDEEIDPDERAPTIEVFDIKDGETINNSIRTFHVKAKNYKGESITQTGEVTASNNGESVAVNWEDEEQISFTLHIHNGENAIEITAEDEEGNTATKQLTIYGEVGEDGEPIGTATISVEATTVGLGYLIPPQEVELYQGERASYVVERLLKEHGYDFHHTGSSDSRFYLAWIEKEGLTEGFDIPEDLLDTLEENNIAVDFDNYQPDILGELDFTEQSGWMYSVNGIYVNVGFADYYLTAGDEVRIRYTLAYGNDIGLGLNNFEKEW